MGDWASLNTDLARQLGAVLLQKNGNSPPQNLVQAAWSAQHSQKFLAVQPGLIVVLSLIAIKQKMQLLGVSETTLHLFGAVSEETALEMAQGALNKSHAQISVSITGVAGPSGGSAEKPVGTVCFAWAILGGNSTTSTQYFAGNRQEVRTQAAQYAISGLLKILQS